jgi:uncharacterized protein YecT (DUF1311 family)
MMPVQGQARKMRIILLFVVAVLFGLAPAFAQDSRGQDSRAKDSREPDRSISEKLPLFAANHCETHKDPANQLICAEPTLSAAAAKLNVAIQDRLNRLADRRVAIEENAEWTHDRNQSCAVFGKEPVRYADIDAVTACLLKEMEERTAILRDPNFDCLATRTAAGSLICDDPSLQLSDVELNREVLALIAKLPEDGQRQAFAEYARWIRDRDRKCNLAGKENIPLSELSASEGCLSDFMRDTTAEMVAAKGDPKRVFGRDRPSPQPNADAVDLCVAQIHAANACDDFLRVSRVIEVKSQVAEQSAQVTAGVEMIVLSPFAACSSIASSCTGTCWDIREGKAAKMSPLDNRDSFPVSRRIRIEKAFSFQKTDNGWRCNSSTLAPIDLGVTVGTR